MSFEEILAEELGSQIKMDDVIDDAPIDSLEYLTLIVRLEKEFGVKLPDEEVGKMKTFRDLDALVTVRQIA